MFNENQPRVPAGSPEGGQWTSGDATEAIQKAASDKATEKLAVGSQQWFKDIVDKISTGFWSSAYEIPDEPAKNAILNWTQDSAQIRQLDDYNMQKQILLNGVTNQTPYTEVYRGESYNILHKEKMLDYLANNIYVKNKILDFQTPIEIPEEIAGKKLFYDYRLASFTKTPSVVERFSNWKDKDSNDIWDSLEITVKNKMGVYGFDISKYSILQEDEVIVGDHKKYKVIDAEMSTSEKPVTFTGEDRIPRHRKKLKVILEQL